MRINLYRDGQFSILFVNSLIVRHRFINQPFAYDQPNPFKWSISQIFGLDDFLFQLIARFTHRHRRFACRKLGLCESHPTEHQFTVMRHVILYLFNGLPGGRPKSRV